VFDSRLAVLLSRDDDDDDDCCAAWKVTAGLIGSRGSLPPVCEGSCLHTGISPGHSARIEYWNSFIIIIIVITIIIIIIYLLIKTHNTI